jgi:hypothetical protein
VASPISLITRHRNGDLRELKGLQKPMVNTWGTLTATLGSHAARAQSAAGAVIGDRLTAGDRLPVLDHRPSAIGHR